MDTEWVERYLEAWNSHDGARVAAFMADDVTYEDLAQGALYQGRAAVEAYVEATHAFSTDYRFLTISAQSDADQYAIEWEMLGTNNGEAGGIPPTNKEYRIRGVSVGRVNEEGRIRSNRDYWNFADYVTQVGLLGRIPYGL